MAKQHTDVVPGIAFILATVIAVGVLAGCGSSKVIEAPIVDEPYVPDATVGQEASPSSESMDAPLPLDPAVRTGKLENGLVYYIRHNEKPDDRAELRLIVDAGSILEDEDQLGLAHFVEHMAFNGTERFQRQELVDYLESTGVRFGPDLNAYTSFDETVYMLQVRTDSSQLFDTGLDILREWSSRISFDAEEIDKERGVVIEEWRLGRGAAARIRDKQLPVLFQGSRYAERLPIGGLEVLQSFPHEAARRFYRDWYRPDLMAVIVVGDVHVDSTESMLRDRFGDLRVADNPRPRETFHVPDHVETLVATATDPEASYSTVSVVYKHEKRDRKTTIDYRDLLVERLYNGMLNQRLSELTQSTDPPFIFGFSGSGGFVRSSDAYNLGASVEEGGTLRALSVLLTEAERVRRHGFTAGELDREQKNLLRQLELSFNERDKTESRSLASELVQHHLEEEPAPGIEFEYETASRLLPSITLSDVNALALSLIRDDNRVILADGPASAALPQRDELLSVFDTVATAAIDPYEDDVSSEPLLAMLPEAGTVVSESRDEVIDVTRWVLSNGATVVLKPTDFKNDQVLFSAVSPGGSSLVPDSLDTPGDYASVLIAQSGVGAFGPIEMEKKLAGKVVRVVPAISERQEGFSGAASPEDLETLMQLVYLYVTAPRADETTYESILQRSGALIEMAQSDPNRVFSDTLSVTLSQYHPRRRPLTPERLDEMDLQKSFSIYRDRFADVGDFTFYFVGAFDLDSIRPLVTQYLAALPASGRSEEPVDLGIRPPTGIVEKVVRKGVEPKSRVTLVMTGTASFTQRNRRLLGALDGVLEIRLRETLREDLGGTYGVSVFSSLTQSPEEQYRVTVSFGCDPDRVDELINTVFAQMDTLREAGTTDEYIAKVRETTLNAHKVGLEENGYWLRWIQYYDEHGLPVHEILDGAEIFFQTLTPDDIREAAAAYLTRENLVRVVLLPEG